MTVRVGFWGAGFISNLHCTFLSASSIEHEISAVHDPDGARATLFAERSGAKVVSEAELLDPVDEVVPFLGGSVFNPATAFLGAVANRAQSATPFRAALPAHRIVDAIYRSADNGGVVVTDPESTSAARNGLS